MGLVSVLLQIVYLHSNLIVCIFMRTQIKVQIHQNKIKYQHQIRQKLL
ncbi:unnamed protein product [Paramecium pentaurelia]|uniref:Uncharacterized protein n=1 Tax=Paramecium pentaurelia TaxID=43138 RepID=A0A8S1W7D6_9CILI|nr:unnamed protein product [Paramecium pentaurelia]